MHINMTIIRFAITSLGKYDFRYVCNGAYDTQELAEQKLQLYRDNNPLERLNTTLGRELEVRPVECDKWGRPVTPWADTPEEFEVKLMKLNEAEKIRLQK